MVRKSESGLISLLIPNRREKGSLSACRRVPCLSRLLPRPHHQKPGVILSVYFLSLIVGYPNVHTVFERGPYYHFQKLSE